MSKNGMHEKERKKKLSCKEPEKKMALFIKREYLILDLYK